MGRVIKVTILDSGILQIVPQNAFSGENNAVQLNCYCSDALKDYTKYIDFESNGVKYRSPAFTDGLANFVFNIPNIISNYNTLFQFVFIDGDQVIKTQKGTIYVQESVNAVDQITFESGDILDDFEQRITLVEGKVDDFLDNFDVSVGTTTTLPAGNNATVTKSGTDLNPIFNFGIPKGFDPTIQIGAVQYGSVLSIVNSGTAQDAVLDFTFPENYSAQLIPAQTIAMQYFDGTRVGNEFIDKGIQGLNLDIIDNDIELTSGFPYKSAAKIKQKATSFGLIPNPNMFWFQADGTPNEIPVVSLFQNIDYANQIFTRHAAQQVDGNGVETYEPRVLDIVTYASALTGDNLTMANAYFKVPVEVTTNVVWVSKDGNDTNAGTKADPYLTIEKAYKTVASGSTIYVKSGSYTEEYNGTSIRYFYCDRVGTWNITGLGFVEIKSISTNLVIQHVGSIMNWKGIIFNGETNTTSVISFFAASDNSGIFNRCKIVGAATNNVATSAGAGINTFECYDCVILEFKSIVLRDSSKIKRSYVVGVTVFYSDGEYHYNKHNYLTYSATAIVTGCSSVKWNKFTSKSTCISYYGTAAVNHSYNTIISLWGASIGGPLFTHYIENDACVPTISNNIYYSDSDANTDRITFLYLAKCLTPTISNNIFRSFSKVKFDHINIVASANVTGKVTMINNYSHCNSNDSGITIAIGGETSFNNKFDNSEIIGNHFIGSLKNYPTENVGSIHLFLLSGCINAKVMYNTFSYAGLACVIKTGSVVNTYTAGGVNYNIFLNNKVDVWARGVKGLLISNNTIQLNTGFTGITAGNRISIDANIPVSATNYSEDVFIKNNVIDSKLNSSNLIYFDNWAGSHGCIGEYNTLNGGQYLLADGTNYSDLVTAQAANKLLNCVMFNPNLDSNLIPSSKIEYAVDLGTDYDDGLDVTSDFGSSTETPVIVTKQQSATWQNGAYIL